MASIQAVISKGSTIKGLDEGHIKFGYGCMIHPFSKIIAEGGSSIIFGDYNIYYRRRRLNKSMSKNEFKNRQRRANFYIYWKL